MTSVLEESTYRQNAVGVADAIRALPSDDESVSFIEQIAGG